MNALRADRTALSLVLLAMLCLVPAARADDDAQSKLEKRDTTTLNTADVQRALTPVLKQVAILSVEPAVLPGLWEVAFQSGGERGVLYIDGQMRFVIAGSIINLATGTNYTKQKFESINTVEFSSFDLDDAIVLGDEKKAKHKVIVFDDPD